MSKYQLDYASGRPQMYDVPSRVRKATRMVKLLSDHFGADKLKKLSVLDVGSSTGIIDHELAGYFKKVVGIDIDSGGIEYAKKKYKKANLTFKLDDAMKLSFKGDTFDIVICAQVYEHVPDSKQLFKEIHRVLKPGGVCYLAALNKLWPMEPHYNLLFLSWLPKKVANKYLSLFGKGEIYYENLETHWGLKKLVKPLEVIDYTTKIVFQPKKFGYGNAIRFPFNFLAFVLAPLLRFTTPTMFWLLVKPEKN